MNILYTNQKAGKSKKAITLIFMSMCIFSFEGFRAGFFTHISGVTPKLFGFIPTSPIEPEVALFWIIPTSVLLFVVFFYFLFQAIWTGVLLQLNYNETNIVAAYNGISKKKIQYAIQNIKKISFKTESSTIGASATVVASGTTVMTERLYIYMETKHKKTKKINLVSGEKKDIRNIGKKIKALMTSQA